MQSIWYSCGYLIMRSIQRPKDLDRQLFPEKILSLRECNQNAVPRNWFDYFSADPSDTTAQGLAAWYSTNEFDLLMPNRFKNRELAQEFLSRIPKQTEVLRIVGMGLAAQYCEQLIAEQTANRPDEQPEGVLTMLQQPKILPTQHGQWLGIDLGWFDYNNLHSWLCESNNQLLIRRDAPVDCLPNEFGLLKSLAAAEYLIPQLSIYNGAEISPNAYPFCLIAYEY